MSDEAIHKRPLRVAERPPSTVLVATVRRIWIGLECKAYRYRDSTLVAFSINKAQAVC